jgi:hypothetical protein
MDFGIVRNRIEAFEAEHGGQEVMLRVNGWFLFPDGAEREANPEGALHGVPADPYLRQQRIVMWHEAYVQRAVAVFDELREKLHNRAKNALRNGTPPPTKSDMEELRRLQWVARQRQKALTKARKQLDAVTPACLRRGISPESQEEAETVLKELQHIQV